MGLPRHDRTHQSSLSGGTRLRVYGDLFLFLQLVADYILLYATARLAGRRTPAWRLLAAAVIGALYGLGYLFAPLGFLYSRTLILLFPSLMLAVAFAPFSFRIFLRLAAYFYVVSFFVAGAAVAVIRLAASSGSLELRALRIRPAGWWPLALALFLGTILAWWLRARAGRWHRDQLRVTLEVVVGGKHATVEGLVDTGNRLREPLSGLPVIVAEAGALTAILPDGLPADLGRGGEWVENAAGLFTEPDWRRRLRVLPYASLGKSGGMLLGFLPDRVLLAGGDHRRSLARTVVGLYGGRLDSGGAYHALVPAEILEQETGLDARIS